MKFSCVKVGISALLIMVFVAPVWAKNVILFVGDGMGVSTITASRIYAGQQLGLDGEEHQLSFDKFPNVALIKTYNLDAQVPDSAGTITAILSGEKTRIGVLGVNGQVPQSDCAAALENEIPSILQLAELTGKKTGVVSTARITHATPAGSYAHTPSRNWENDSQLTSEAISLGCQDIAAQLVDFPHGDGIDIILGGGRSQFMPKHTKDPEYPDKRGLRGDERNLIKEWANGGKQRSYVWNQQQFQKLAKSTAQQILGLFEPSHMQFETDRVSDNAGEPSLADMTTLALGRLAGSDEGFFLLVEAGRIDHAHHIGNAYRALVDTTALDDAVAASLKMVDLSETLIIVTADHSHTFTISGYPKRGNPILGKVTQAENLVFPSASGKPYTTLGYANGPGFRDEYPDLTNVDTLDPDYQQLAGVPLTAETHGGEDVAAFAVGLKSAQVAGVMEQNLLYNVMFDALFTQTEQTVDDQHGNK